MVPGGTQRCPQEAGGPARFTGQTEVCGPGAAAVGGTRLFLIKRLLAGAVEKIASNSRAGREKAGPREGRGAAQGKGVQDHVGCGEGVGVTVA